MYISCLGQLALFILLTNYLCSYDIYGRRKWSRGIDGREREREINIKQKPLEECWGMRAQKVVNINEWIDSQREDKEFAMYSSTLRENILGIKNFFQTITK